MLDELFLLLCAFTCASRIHYYPHQNKLFPFIIFYMWRYSTGLQYHFQGWCFAPVALWSHSALHTSLTPQLPGKTASSLSLSSLQAHHAPLWAPRSNQSWFLEVSRMFTAKLQSRQPRIVFLSSFLSTHNLLCLLSVCLLQEDPLIIFLWAELGACAVPGCPALPPHSPVPTGPRAQAYFRELLENRNCLPCSHHSVIIQKIRDSAFNERGLTDNDEDVKSYVLKKKLKKQTWNLFFFLLDPQHTKIRGQLCFFFLLSEQFIRMFNSNPRLQTTQMANQDVTYKYVGFIQTMEYHQVKRMAKFGHKQSCGWVSGHEQRTPGRQRHIL